MPMALKFPVTGNEFADHLQGGQREELHRSKEHKLSLGMWGWYNTEYETDQRPMMHVMLKPSKDFTGRLQGANAIHPLLVGMKPII